VAREINKVADGSKNLLGTIDRWLIAQSFAARPKCR
jgi:hypothetical protein